MTSAGDGFADDGSDREVGGQQECHVALGRPKKARRLPALASDKSEHSGDHDVG
jgi:hypothetical protein